jgi:streptomycin 6-kinase
MDCVDLSDRMVNSCSISKENVEMDEETHLPFGRLHHSKFIHYPQVLWAKCDPSEIQGAAG